MINDQQLNDFIGINGMIWAIGVVEDNIDPLTLGRVRVRWFGFHPEDRDEVPTIDLPWAQVLQPTNSASISGIGWSPNGLLPGSWVFGFFMDGRTAQYPVVIGTWAGIHKPNAGTVAGGTADPTYAGVLPPNQYHGQSVETDKYQPQNQSNLPDGTAIKDDGTYLTKEMTNWPLKIYQKSDLQCKDGMGSLRFHHATAAALEKLTNEYNGGKKFSITSAYRTAAYNARLNGAAKASQHIQGRALDIPYSTIGGRGNVFKFAQYAVRCGFVGFGLYDTFIHIDTGRGRVWNGARDPKFIAAIRQAGWYEGKKGLEGIKVDTSQQTANNSSNTTTTNTSTGSSGTQPANEAEAVDRINKKLDAAGYTGDHQKAAVLGTIKQESGFNSGAQNGIGAYGLNQWLGPRRTDYEAFAASRGVSPSDFDTQVDYMIKDLDSGHGMGAGKMLRNSTDLDSAMGAMNRYERFKGYQNGRNGIETGKRYSYAEQFLGNGGTGNTNSKVAGFQDPTNSLPYNEYRGAPSTNHAARGLNGNTNQPAAVSQSANRVTSVPIGGDTGTFGEPPVAYNAKYPYNKTYSTLSGHLIEYDDSPNAERINIMHKSGSKIEYSAKGTVSQKAMGNYYNFTMSDSFTYTDGDQYVTARGNQNFRTTADMILHADGSFQIIGGNDKSEIYSGDVEMGVGGKYQIKVGKLIIEAEAIDLYSTSYINMEAEQAINIKSKEINISGENNVNVKTKDLKMQGDSTGIKGNSISMDSPDIDLARSVESPKDALPAKSTAIGKIPERTVVKKEYKAKENPDSYDGFEEGMTHYLEV
ncbi:baseplate hub subunit and tail lysozyme [Ochrobactrum phage vB_OspM_OC]|nr:baseplate hub subunit and tail lysozyme [Ochrobactrum phage vB_OspM_OC]